ncbi:hypothetical protein EVAR_90298_1 [Eumeta japonica]|uniref:Uncharacterized protein n=1 Tax=Eumeta variegata TaxID=151549 RepID=A0A4C1Z7N4_EUMVA|nr:hypothetical protein EVAR_90298_1 [Eumeta japonica]
MPEKIVRRSKKKRWSRRRRQHELRLRSPLTSHAAMKDRRSHGYVVGGTVHATQASGESRLHRMRPGNTQGCWRRVTFLVGDLGDPLGTGSHWNTSTGWVHFIIPTESGPERGR